MTSNRTSPFRTVLGEEFDRLPAPLQTIRNAPRPCVWHGSAQVRRGQGWLARGVAALFRFPAEADQVPVSVTFAEGRQGEVWQRDFGGHKFESRLYAVKQGDQHKLIEQLGWVRFVLDLKFEDGRLYFVPRAWSLWRLPLPGFLLPNGESFEHTDGQRFCFSIEIAAPFVRLIVSYQGWLEPRT